MDQITHQVRLANWKKIIEQCSARPQGTTVKQWLTDHDISAAIKVTTIGYAVYVWMLIHK